MRLNKDFRKINRKYLRIRASKRRKKTLWLDRKSERHVQMMAAMFFIGFILTIAYGFKTLASWSEISQIYFGLAVIFSFIPNNWLPIYYRIRKELKVLLGICALAPFVTGIALLLNYHITTNEVQQFCKVSGYSYQYDDRIIMVTLNNEELNEHIEIRKFSLDKFNFEPDSACYIIKKGIFGINAIHGSSLIPK